MSTAKLILCAFFFVLVLTCSVANTPDWSDEGEEDAFKKDLVLDELTIHDYSRFYSQYGNRGKPGTSPAFNFTVRDLPVLDEDISLPDDILVDRRWKRQAPDNMDYSGSDPCETNDTLCNGLGQTCVFNTSFPDDYYCECSPGFDETTSATCTELPESQRLYLTTPLDTATYNTELNNSKSEDFQEFQRGCDRAFTAVFRHITGFVALRTLEFRKGIQQQTIVVYVLYFKTSMSTSALVSVAKAVLGMEKANKIVINGTMYSISLFSGIYLTYGATATGNDAVNWCSDSSLYSCDKDRICVDGGLRYTCNCKPGFVDLSGKCVDSRYQYELYPYGTNRDVKLKEGDDDIERVSVSTGFPFSDTTYHHFYLGINGLITFDQRDSGLGVRLYEHSKMFSPYQADIITRGGYGSVWYRIYANRSEAEAVYQKADREVMEFFELRNFRSRLVIVITWDRVAHYSKRNSNNRVTFQTIFISDGETTYALVYYKNDSMLWDPAVTTRVVMGYSDGRSWSSSVKQTPYSYTSVAITSMGTLQGNAGRKGTWAYKVGQRYSPDQICDDWYNTELPYLLHYYFIDSWLPRCPCSRRQLGWRWTFTRRIPEANIWCYNIGYTSGRRFFPYGRDCCYSYTGSLRPWVQSMPHAGGITRFNPIYRENLKENKEYDRDPHTACCGSSSTSASCRKYYTLRPTGWCTASTSNDGWSWGDPHILTLDGKGYTFNGWGEYTMVMVDTVNVTFRLQCRTDRAETENGIQTNATIFSAFAMAENGVRVFVKLDPNDNQSLVIYANGTDQSRNFRDQESYALETEAFSLINDNNSLVILFGASGIGITIIPALKALGISVDMPETFRNETKGLLGNYNGVDSDDFILPNGTVLPSNMTDKQKFDDFGSHWAILPNESLFIYDNRMGPENYSHPEFEPLFLDEVEPERLNESYKACGGTQKLACIYDYLATGNKQVAEASKQFQESAEAVNAERQNTVPNLNATGLLNVTGNNPVEFFLDGKDADGDSITYFPADDLTGNITLNKTSGRVTYHPNPSVQASLRFYALDTHNASSALLTVPVMICTECSYHGYCDIYNPRNISTQTFQIASCVCDVAWTGEECDQDRNACLENPCVSGQNCTDLTPEQQGDSQIGYNCSDCPRGFGVDNATNKCQDIDECLVEDMCDQICNNTEGSYLCTCNHGYRLGVDGRSCIDVNECAEKTDGCVQICTNYPGGFNCSCYPGYIYQLDNTCTQDPQTHANCSRSNCSQECRIVNGNSECFCLQGYALSKDNKTCVDIDECEQDVCSQECNNTMGSFTCTCYPGYQLDSDKITCNECPDMYYGTDCTELCDCNGRHTGCDKVRGCICGSGWTGSFCERDIDECQETPNICNNSREVCANTNGSYRCDCQTGYTRGSDQSCTDINECDPLSGLNECSFLEDCVNTIGSFYCSCKTGYQNVNESSDCTDINECDMPGSCEQLCLNTDGSYNCDCYYGYRLDVDRVSCKEVEKVCSPACEYCTLLENNTEVCFCKSGYTLLSNKSCVDIDECNETNNVGCSHNCTNIPGSFQCSCPAGFQIGNDRKTCIGCGDGKYGVNCTENCTCGVGAIKCDKVSGCVCSSSWNGSKCDQDIDECKNDTVKQECQNKNATCSNFPGGYRCDCDSGYRQNVSGTCEDIDECLDSPCSQKCENFAGGYRCGCNEGFNVEDDGNCVDVDECEFPNNTCEQQCMNIAGSYRCYCDKGYESSNNGLNCTECTKNWYGDNCKEQCQCNVNNTASCHHVTGNCTCKKEWMGSTCDTDVDECESDKHNCSGQHMYCNNTIGGYDCVCNNGYHYNASRVCEECTENWYGDNCTEQCQCNVNNTASCHHVTGNCTCKGEWTGSTCDTDVDECELNKHNCSGQHMYCNNTIGGYDCVCNDGYHYNASRVCVEIQQILIVMKLAVNILFNNESSEEFQKVSDEIIRELRKHLGNVSKTIQNISFIAIWKGSLNYKAEMTVIDVKNPTVMTEFAFAMANLVRVNFSILGSEGPVMSFFLNGTQINDACDVWGGVNICGPKETCEISTENGLSCKLQNDSSVNLGLAIGLGVGIPLFIILILVIAFLVYRYIKKKKSTRSNTFSDDNQSEISTIFSRRLPIFGMLRHHGMYKPDNFSETSEEDNRTEHYRTHNSDRGYSDNSPWTTRRLKESKRLDTEEPASFSWDHFYQTAVPEEEFHIKRPQISVSPNPTYQISIQTPSLDEA